MTSPLENLINLTAKLPGLGKKSATRIALHLLKNREKLMHPLADAIIATEASIKTCEICGNYDISSPCHICVDEKRDKSTIMVLEDVSDLWAINRGRIYNGVFHILGGALSAMDGVGPDKLNIASLLAKVSSGEVKEVILATNATMEGQTTAHYLSQRLQEFNIKITRLAQGVPLGGEIEYLDEGTLLTALNSRRDF
ncbi:MAG: recombination mediator RecR [Rickettsiales bacterium]|nr:recombination mediator RecR [Rickettsiales bacterium]